MIIVSYELEIDLCKDYGEMIQRWMTEQGFCSNKNGMDLWYEFFNLQKKTIRPRKRNVLYSKEFNCPLGMSEGLSLLVQKFKNGEDVSLHLSKYANNPSEFDELLYDWGIYHFHLGKTTDAKTGRIKRTGPILFAKVDNINVYCINIYDHGKGIQPWSKQEMLRILHRNWPETIKDYKLPEGIRLHPDTLSPPNDIEYATLRKNGISTMTFVEDGVAYISPGGGYTSSGHSTEIVMLCQRIHKTLKRYELYIKENITSLAEYIEKFARQSSKQKLHFKLIEKDGALYIGEMQSMILLIKVSI